MSVVKAEHIKDYKIKLTFFDGTIKVIDFEPKISAREIYRPFLIMNKFLQFKVDQGDLRWPGNILDFHYNQLVKM